MFSCCWLLGRVPLWVAEEECIENPYASLLCTSEVLVTGSFHFWGAGFNFSPGKECHFTITPAPNTHSRNQHLPLYPQPCEWLSISFKRWQAFLHGTLEAHPQPPSEEWNCPSSTIGKITKQSYVLNKSGCPSLPPAAGDSPTLLDAWTTLVTLYLPARG